jgi:hypothetical protein
MHVLRPQFPISRRNNFSLHSEWEICSISLESNFLNDLGESLAANRFIALNLFKRMMTHARVAFQLSNSRLKNLSLGRVLIAAHLFFLLTLERDWAVENIIPLFDFQRTLDEQSRTVLRARRGKPVHTRSLRLLRMAVRRFRLRPAVRIRAWRYDCGSTSDLRPPPTPDFSLAVSPTSQMVNGGSSGSVSPLISA